MIISSVSMVTEALQNDQFRVSFGCSSGFEYISVVVGFIVCVGMLLNFQESYTFKSYNFFQLKVGQCCLSNGNPPFDF